MSLWCHTFRSTSDLPEGILVSWAMACLHTVRRSTRTRAQAANARAATAGRPHFVLCVSNAPPLPAAQVVELSSLPDAVLVRVFSISSRSARFQELRQERAMTTKAR